MDVTIALSIPSTEADGTTPETAASFSSIKLYQQAGSGTPTLIATIAQPFPNPLAYVVKGLTPGAYGFSATGVDLLNRETPQPSAQVVPFVVPPPPPMLTPPTIASVTPVPGT